ncbi:MAG TPA: class I SAM-dependent methyltransferase [Actinomycetes bacterium]|nr:class I SAM-dependent methyltransferase [Actinomycetes bacterium]
MDPDAAELRGFRALLTDQGQAVLRSLAAYDPATALTEGDRLRRAGHPDHLVAAALTQARLRARARPRLGDLADRLYLTPDGLEQLTRPEVAARHAARFAAAVDGPVLDLCCGVGGDLTALAAAGLAVTGVDRDPLAVAVARANLAALGLDERAEVRLGDVPGDLDATPDLDVDLAEAAGVFVDPARRSGRGRALDPRTWSPPWDAVLGLAARVPATGAKTAPGLAHHLLPAGAEAEWVSVGGGVVECALWWGPLGSGVARRATLLPASATVTGDGTARAPVGPVGRYLHEPDGAVIRAGLVAEVADPLGATLLDPTIAYLSTPGPVVSPFLTTYEVVDVLPFHLKRLRALLRDRGVGRLTVKKRGTAVAPEELRARLRLSGDAEATVVLTRVAGAQTVLLVEPVPR